MALLINDRDLAAEDVRLFTEAAIAGTVLAKGGTAALANGQLTVTGVDLDAAGVQAGHVAVVAGTSGQEVVEVLSLLGDETADVSRPRRSTDDQKISPQDATGLTATVITFAGLIERSQRWALENLRIETGDDGASAIDPAVTDATGVQRLIIAKALAEGFATAAAVGTSESLTGLAALYARRLAQAVEQAEAPIDLDGDGEPDATRRMSVMVMKRM